MGLVALSAIGCGDGSAQTLAGGAAGMAGAGGAGAIGGSCGMGSGGSSGSGAAGAPVCPEDPADGPVAPECGIWVSQGLGCDGNDGTQAAPVASLTRAIELAAEGPGRVYACFGIWSDALVVPGNVSLHGGFDCKHGWTYAGKEEKSTLITPLSPVALTWVEGDSEGKPILTDFSIRSGKTAARGDSSIGVFVRDDVPLTIRRCEVTAASGSPGENGEDAVFGNEQAPAGAPGHDGANACSAPVSKGGALVENACATGTSAGGVGGDGGTVIATNGGDGDAPTEWNGNGGLGEQFAPACTDGESGLKGADGALGEGGRFSLHRLTAEGYVGAPGQDGQPGQHGHGGGGGGATFGSAAACGGASPGGAAGGSGGAGGCGGKAGTGGQAGGSSIGIAVHTTTALVSIEDTRIATGSGGDGGRGGKWQYGGDGGEPGQGGAGFGTIKAGCKGGHGGSGGRGGWGGGGSGGSALCVAATTLVGVNRVAIDCTLGNPGVGGDGHFQFPQTLGDDGVATEYAELNP